MPSEWRGGGGGGGGSGLSARSFSGQLASVDLLFVTRRARRARRAPREGRGGNLYICQRLPVPNRGTAINPHEEARYLRYAYVFYA